MMEIKTLILDFDGTIADTQKSILQTIDKTAEILEIPIGNHSEITQLIGLPLKETFVRVLQISDETVLNDATKIYRQLYNDISLETVELYPEVKIPSNNFMMMA